MSGGIGSQNDKQYLIGQKVTATVATGGLTANSFNWTVSGGEPFKDWMAEATYAVFTPFGTETESQMQFYFRKWSDGAKSTISTPVHLDVPSGALPVVGFNITLERDCSVDKPLNSLNAWSGNVRGAPDPTNPDGMVFEGAVRPRNGQTVSRGIIWEVEVTTPTQFGSDGGWNYTQLMCPIRLRTFNSEQQKRYFSFNWALDTDVMDASFGYGLGSTPFYPADGQIYQQGDSPSDSWERGDFFNVGTTSFLVSDKFKTYTMYKPQGVDSCWVPLKFLNWFWEGAANPKSLSS